MKSARTAKKASKTLIQTEVDNNVPLELIKELYRCYDFFNQHFTKGALPRPMIVVGSDGKKKAAGWFCGDSWVLKDQTICEITLCGESFCQGVDDVMNTLLHEMAHLKNFYDNDRKVVDCTAQQRHNKIFKTTAEFFGLSVSSSKRFGPAHTHIGSGAREAIDLVKPNEELFKLYRNMKLKEKEKEKKESKLKPVMIDKSVKELIEKVSEELGLTQKEFTQGAVQIFSELPIRISNAAHEIFVNRKKFKNASDVENILAQLLTEGVKMKGSIEESK